MANLSDSIRIGHGFDIHRLQSGGVLMVGGVKVAEGISALAHSDGDVALHALVDALLGAIGAGDIGQMFPNSDARWKGANSRAFVEGAMREVRARGFAVVDVDITVMAERPKLMGFKAEMVKVIGGMVGGAVNVKAGTNEGVDAVGRGEAIAAHAVVLIAKVDSGQ